MSEKPFRLRRPHAGLVVVDLQERLLGAMFEKERLVLNVSRLLQGAGAIGLPVISTEQYPQGLGSTVPEIASVLGSARPLQKTAFSACGAAGFCEAIESHRISQVILCGIETHVCVSQTCLDLLEKGLSAFVVADAVSSRTSENMRCGLDRMRGAGAVIVSTEMVLFELLEKAGTEEFKKVLALVK